MKARFETTEEEDEKAKTLIEEALSAAYGSGRNQIVKIPYADELWEALLKILGIGEWDD